MYTAQGKKRYMRKGKTNNERPWELFSPLKEINITNQEDKMSQAVYNSEIYQE